MILSLAAFLKIVHDGTLTMPYTSSDNERLIIR